MPSWLPSASHLRFCAKRRPHRWRLDPNRAPRTWSELLAYSKALTEFNSDGTFKRAGYFPNFGNTWLYLYSFQLNGSFMSPDGRKCTFDSPENVAALKYMVDGYDLEGGYEKAKGFETSFLAHENDPFIVGKVAMKTDGDWILADLVRYGPSLDVGVAPAPVAAGFGVPRLLSAAPQ